MTKTLTIVALAAALTWRPGGPCEEAYQEYLKAKTFGAREFLCNDMDQRQDTVPFVVEDNVLEILRLQERIASTILNSREEL